MRTSPKALLTLILLILSASATAIDLSDSYIEHADIILNLEKSASTGSAYGYLLAKPCSDCQSLRIEVNENTEFFLNGKATNPTALDLKIDWQGMIFFTSDKPAIATRLMLQ